MSRLSIALGGLLVVAALSGACGEPTLLVVPTGCAADTDCKGERICVEKACVYPDGLGGGTGGGWDGPGPPPGAVGSACEEDLDCAGARATCLTELGFGVTMPGGYCSDFCGSDNDCSEDSICDGLFGLCVDACETSDDCREGYSCQGFFDTLPACRPDVGFP